MTAPARPAGAPLAGVIFDIGGTLIYPQSADERCIASLARWLRDQDWPEEIEDALREARHWVLAETQATGRQHTMQEGIRRALAGFDHPADDAFIAAAERVFFRPELAAYQPFPSAVRALHRLRRAGLRLGCISNATSHWLIEQIVAVMGFGPFLDPVISSAAFGRVKPDPSIFHHVLDRWGLPPQRAAMVGDTLAADVAGARAAGLWSVYVTMTPHPGNAQHPDIHADAEADSLDAAAAILFGWAGAPKTQRRGRG